MMQFSFTFSFLSSVLTFQIPAQVLHLVNRSAIEFLDWTEDGGLCKSPGHENAFRLSSFTAAFTTGNKMYYSEQMAAYLIMSNPKAFLVSYFKCSLLCRGC